MILQSVFDLDTPAGSVYYQVLRLSDDSVLTARTNTNVRADGNGSFFIELSINPAWPSAYIKWDDGTNFLSEAINEESAGGSGGLTEEEHAWLMAIAVPILTQQQAQFKCKIAHKGDYYSVGGKAMLFDGERPGNPQDYTWLLTANNVTFDVFYDNGVFRLNDVITLNGGRYRYKVTGTFEGNQWTLEGGTLIVHEV